MKRRTEIYKILIRKKRAIQNSTDYNLEELKDKVILKDYLDFFFKKTLYSENNDSKVTLDSKSLCYYIDQVVNDNNIYKARIQYIKFNKKTKVKNISTLESKYIKDKNEGDEERQHFVLKTYDNTNRAVLVYEKISGAITIGMLENNINKFFREWIKSNYEDDEKKNMLQYEIKLEIVPSPDFISELLSMEKISLLKVTGDKEKITSDEDIIFSEDNISRKEIDLVYKPVKGLSFSTIKIKNYFEKYKKGNVDINRIIISGRKEGNSISLDTDRMKLSEYIDTELDIDGLVKSENILKKYEELITCRFNEYFDNIFIEIEDTEE